MPPAAGPHPVLVSAGVTQFTGPDRRDIAAAGVHQVVCIPSVIAECGHRCLSGAARVGSQALFPSEEATSTRWRRRQAPGLLPVARENMRQKWLWSAKPHMTAISAMGVVEPASSSQARSNRNAINHWWGVTPVDCLKARAKWLADRRHAAATERTDTVWDRWSRNIAIARCSCQGASALCATVRTGQAGRGIPAVYVEVRNAQPFAKTGKVAVATCGATGGIASGSGHDRRVVRTRSLSRKITIAVRGALALRAKFSGQSGQSDLAPIAGGPARRSSAVFWVRGIAQALRAEGLDVDALLHDAGLDGGVLDRPDGRVPTERVNRLWQLAVVRSGRPMVGLASAFVPQPALFDVVGYAMLSAPDLRGVLERIVRYIRIVSDAAMVTVAGNPDLCRLSLALPGDAADVPWQRYAFDLLAFLTFLRWIMMRELRPLVLELTVGPESGAQVLAEAHQCPIRLGAATNGLAFSPDDLALKLPTAHAGLSGVHERIAEEQLARLDRYDTTNRVRATIAARIADGEPTRAMVARTVGMSERTLQRRLEAEGTSFRQVLDTLRKELAETYMEQHDLSLAEVAYLLGFTDQGSFFRATSRWFGTSPGQVRLRLRERARG